MPRTPDIVAFQDLWATCWPSSITFRLEHEPSLGMMAATLGPLYVRGQGDVHRERGCLWIAHRESFDKWANSTQWYTTRLPQTQTELVALLTEVMSILVRGEFDPNWPLPQDLTPFFLRVAKRLDLDPARATLEALLADRKAHARGYKVAKAEHGC